AGRGRPWVPNQRAPIAEVLQTILDLALIARAVDAIGLAMPDLKPERFLIHGRPGRLTLADLSGVKATDPTQAALTHSAQISALAKTVASSPDGRFRSELPPAVEARLIGNTPLPLLVRAVVTALGRTDTAKGPPKPAAVAVAAPATGSSAQSAHKASTVATNGTAEAPSNSKKNGAADGATKSSRRRRRRNPRPRPS
ncbi:MAG: hypothetical protein AAFN74_27955, partial [Myxococcota bacterium]